MSLSNGHASHSAQRTFVEQKIRELRQRLLDLSGRNALLNFKHPAGSSIRIVDELPNQVAEALRNKKHLILEGVPRPHEAELRQHGYFVLDEESGNEVLTKQPQAEEWARCLGIRTDYELPTEEDGKHHRDLRLQTLQFPDKLEGRLRSIKGKAESAQNEMGCHVLFLAVGFLEWYESDDSEEQRLAPLYTIPVDLTRGKIDREEGIYQYAIAPRDEDVHDNITLREKLLHDFGVVLPATSDAETPEEYFTTIREAVLVHQPRWKVHRSITLATFNFQKQAMYEDLDPERWAEGHCILDHPIIQAFFTSVEFDPANEEASQAEYSIDQIEKVLDCYPIVFDADSSQHSAIVDAIDGKSLVIEGPPGTGKSQTIANLIAACMAANKSVLFVAEKMAALEVVKSRLESAGLGDFCLELHGHKAQKGAVLQSFASRLAFNRKSPRKIGIERDLLLEGQSRLNEHADGINSAWKQTAFTIHEVLTGAARYQIELEGYDTLPRIPAVAGDTFTEYSAEKLLKNAQHAAALHAKVASQTPSNRISSHYWCGVRDIALLRQGATPLVAALRDWSAVLEGLTQQTPGAKRLHSQESWQELSLTDLTEITESTSALPGLQGSERLEAVPALAENLAEVQQTLEQARGIHTAWTELAAALEQSAICSEETESDLQRGVQELRVLGVNHGMTLDEMSSSSGRLAAIETDALDLEATYETVRREAPEAFHQCLEVSVEGLGAFMELAGVIKSLPRSLWRHRSDLYDNPELDPLLEDLRARLGDLVERAKQLQRVFSLENLPKSEHLDADIRKVSGGGFFSWLSVDWWSARSRIKGLAKSEKSARSQALRQATALRDFIRAREEAAEACRENPSLGSEYRGVDTPIGRITELRAWYRKVRQLYGDHFSSKSGLAKALFTMDADLAYAIAEFDGGSLLQRTQELHRQVKETTGLFRSPRWSKTSRTLLGGTGLLSELRSDLDTALHRILPKMRERSCTLAVVQSYSEKLAAQREAVTTWQSGLGATTIASAGFRLSVHFLEDHVSERQALESTLAVATVVKDRPELLEALRADPSRACYEELSAIPELLRPALREEQQSREKFGLAGDVDLTAWLEGSRGTIQGILERNASALANQPWLQDWLGYQRVKQSLIPEGLAEFLDLMESQGIDEQRVHTITKAIIYKQLAAEIMEECPVIGDFYGPDHEVIRDHFQTSDEQFRDLKRAEIAAQVGRRDVPGGRKGGKVSEHTELALIQHEVNKKTRHIPLRALLSRAGHAASALKPCFMMSPMSVATHLTPGHHQFDILVMDEASQIKPEDALGSIARASSIVIVGDPKQLPPTSFFDKSVGDLEDADDEVSLQDSESILDAVSSIFPRRRLRWHYRSRHEGLIAFSARNFYEDDLVLFPSPFEVNEEFGIKSHFVEDGFFEKVNQPEARQVAEFVINHFGTGKSESLGVVAMSASQATAIEAELERRAKEDPQVERIVADALEGEDSLFIKNLENVQGDERDVIVISMTYGPKTPGAISIPQRFGPINTDGGWRRLNVLFTRARKRMHVFSSMRAQQVVVDGGSRRGKRALRDFLAYCTKAPEALAHETGKQPDSDFEVAVMNALHARGHRCTPQLGVAGYFLDLAVRHPIDSGRYLLGVECDGATYHSAKSARDRDRLRQQVLEGLGWKIVRIWSADWFNNPQAQIQRIENAIREVMGGQS